MSFRPAVLRIALAATVWMAALAGCGHRAETAHRPRLPACEEVARAAQLDGWRRGAAGGWMQLETARDGLTWSFFSRRGVGDLFYCAASTTAPAGERLTAAHAVLVPVRGGNQHLVSQLRAVARPDSGLAGAPPAGTFIKRAGWPVTPPMGKLGDGGYRYDIAGAIDFTFADRAGATMTLREQHRAALLAFFEKGCRACDVSSDALRLASKRAHTDGVSVFFVFPPLTDAAYVASAKALDPAATPVVDANRSIFASFAVHGMPRQYLVRADGTIPYSHVGSITADHLGSLYGRFRASSPND